MRIAGLVALASALVFSTGAGAAMTPLPVLKQRDSRFGNILATRGHKALYYWTVEKRDFRVHCTGACARAWPPIAFHRLGR